METMDLSLDAAWPLLFGAGREHLGEQLRAAGDTAPLALRAAWLIEAERLPHEADRLLQREPLEDLGLRALLASAAAQMYDDAPAALRHAETALRHHPDPLQTLHGWAALLQGQAQLELGWPARALAPLQTALRVAHRDGLPLLQLDALRLLARVHDEAGDAAARDAVLASAQPLLSEYATLPASDSMQRLKAQIAAREALLGGPWPTLQPDERLSQRLACVWQDWLRGESGVAAEVQSLRALQRQQYWPLKWQVDLGQIEGALAARDGQGIHHSVLSTDAAPSLSWLQAAVLDAGHARLAGRGLNAVALADDLARRGLHRLSSRLALVLTQDADALAAWWKLPGRDAVDALWLAPLLLPLWPALLALPDARRSAADQQALRLLGERLRGPSLEAAADASSNTAPPADLTPREWQVLQLIGQDWSNAQIAAKLFVSEATVKTHINRIYAKLELSDRDSARHKARALGA